MKFKNKISAGLNKPDNRPITIGVDNLCNKDKLSLAVNSYLKLSKKQKPDLISSFIDNISLIPENDLNINSFEKQNIENSNSCHKNIYAENCFSNSAVLNIFNTKNFTVSKNFTDQINDTCFLALKINNNDNKGNVQFNKQLNDNYQKLPGSQYKLNKSLKSNQTKTKNLSLNNVNPSKLNSFSSFALEEFINSVNPQIMTKQELEKLFDWYALDISFDQTKAWEKMYEKLNSTLPYAFVPDTSMDNTSRLAIDQFAMTIKPDIMTREQLENLFNWFTKDISISYPEAWAQMHGILNKSLPDAFVPDTSMDDTSRLAIDQFAMTIKPEVMTREDL
ncbi:MAG: hypothetical protein AB1782_12705, partial [Cyanobacteriota bacterium]